MSTAVVAKELKRLCYTDMKEFAKELIAKLEEQHALEVPFDHAQLCEALSSMDEVFLSTVDTDADKLVRKVFTRGRGKAIHVEVNAGGGYTVSFRKQIVHGVRLSDALNNLIDQIVALQAMGVDP